MLKLARDGGELGTWGHDGKYFSEQKLASAFLLLPENENVLNWRDVCHL